MSRESPYTVLKKVAQKWIDDVVNRPYKTMWMYPASTIATDKWTLYDLAQRVQAAEQLGYDVVLKWSKDGLIVQYVKKLPPTPWQFVV